MRLRAIAPAGVLVVMAIAIPSAAAALPRLLTEDFATSFSVAPAAIVVSGDGSALVAGQAAWIGRDPNPNHGGSQFGRITWTAWTASHGTGVGVYWLNNCAPNCAQGTYFPHDVKIVASRVRNALFTRLVLSPSAAGGKPRVFVLQHAGSGYVWT
jgi:hypothetical protein